MNSTKLIVFLFTIVFSFSATAQPDYILYNGKIFTSDEDQLYVEALSVTKDKISATGKSTDILKLAGTNTKKINLQGKTVTPGFNDAHFHHMPPYDGKYIMFNLEGPLAPSRSVLEDSITKLTKVLPKGTWIHTTLGPEIMNDKSLDRFALDKIAPDHPIRLWAMWGHISIFNTAALKYLKLLDKQPEIKAGFFERLPNSNVINGRVYDNAQYGSVMPQHLIDSDKFVASLQQLNKEALEFGVTSIQNMCTFSPPDRYVTLWQKAKPSIRFRLIKWADMDTNGKLLIPTGSLQTEPKGNSLLTSSGIKWMIEGTPIEKNAFYKAGYKEPSGWHGILYFTREEIQKMLSSSIERNEQSLFHLAGDSLTEMVLTVMEQMKSINWKKFRVRFEHGTAITTAMLDKMKSLGITVVINPIHSGMDTNPRLLNGDVDKDWELSASLLKAQVPLAIGSDGPLNPFLNIMLAVLRKRENISIEQAVIAYTKTSAYAEFAETEKGTLTVGKAADLVVLSQDIFSVPPHQLPATHSVLTMVNGKIALSTKDITITN